MTTAILFRGERDREKGGGRRRRELKAGLALQSPQREGRVSLIQTRLFGQLPYQHQINQSSLSVLHYFFLSSF